MKVLPSSFRIFLLNVKSKRIIYFCSHRKHEKKSSKDWKFCCSYIDDCAILCNHTCPLWGEALNKGLELWSRAYKFGTDIVRFSASQGYTDKPKPCFHDTAQTWDNLSNSTGMKEKECLAWQKGQGNTDTHHMEVATVETLLCMDVGICISHFQ